MDGTRKSVAEAIMALTYVEMMDLCDSFIEGVKSEDEDNKPVDLRDRDTLADRLRVVGRMPSGLSLGGWRPMTAPHLDPEIVERATAAMAAKRAELQHASARPHLSRTVRSWNGGMPRGSQRHCAEGCA